MWQNSLLNRELTGNFLLESVLACEDPPPETSANSVVCEIYEMKFPCATEQGINSTTTGNLIPANRELAQIDPLAAVKRLFRAVA